MSTEVGPPARRPRTSVVLIVLLVAAGVVGWSTTTLLRDPVSVHELAIDRAVPPTKIGRPVPLPAARALHVYLVPHPDDELSGWTSLTDAPGLYPVIVLLTEGEATARCTEKVFVRHAQPELGEIVPDPPPTAGRATPACRGARMASFRSALEDAAALSPVMKGPWELPGRVVHLDSGVATVQQGAHATLVTMDLGDGSLDRVRVEAAVRDLLTGHGGALPDLPVGRLTVAAYYGVETGPADRPCPWPALCPPGDSGYSYRNLDHLAVRDAGRALADVTQEGSWLVTHPYDPDASVVRSLPRDDYARLMALGPGSPARAERLGSYQRWYGWLAFPDVWRVGDLPLESDEVLFSRVQVYEVVAP